MKKTIYKGLYALSALVAASLAASCSDFDEINVNPFAAGPEQTQIEYFINNSIVGAQQDPDVAERAFVLYWKDAARYNYEGTLSEGYTNDGWTQAYYNQSSSWQSHINSAIQLYAQKKEAGTAFENENNVYQVARIWRAYLMSEFTDIFGALPIEGFQGVNPDFNSAQEVYDFILQELGEAVAAIDPSVTPANPTLDLAYGFNFDKWIRFGNSLRMRLAMRLSKVNPAKAQAEFEKAVATGKYIENYDQIFSVEENNGWDPLTGVMTRPWNLQVLSATVNNLTLGLGGITSQELLPQVLVTEGAAEAKYLAKDEMGIYYPDHFAIKTNDPAAGYFADGLPYSADPRVFKIYNIPGNTQSPQWWKYPWGDDVTNKTDFALMKAENPEEELLKIDAKFTWNAFVGGNWYKKGPLNKVYSNAGTQPRLSLMFRNGTMRRVFFGDWESYFLIAEAKEYGWKVPMDGKTAYEKGITASFTYWDNVTGGETYKVTPFLARYLADESYSRVGTSVAWDHTAEPASVTMTRTNGYTGAKETFEYNYPDNHLYRGGTVKNDHLTKIITQKYLANNPWLPLEAWSDHRRLGLPFFENPAVEDTIETLPALTEGNYMESRAEFFPERVTFPTALKNNVPEGYKQAVELLGGDDSLYTPLFWSQSAK